MKSARRGRFVRMRLLLAALVSLAGAAAAACFLPGPKGSPGALVLPARPTLRRVTAALIAGEQLRWGPPFMLYAWLTDAHFESGAHWLGSRLSPAQLSRWLGRTGNRPVRRLVVPEGFNRFQLARRVERLHLCSNVAFSEVATEQAWLASKGLEAHSAEGYLLPATYRVYVNTPAKDLVERLLDAGLARVRELGEQHPSQLRALEAEFGWDSHEVLTLASMIERESGSPSEQPVIASVFFNRLRDASFLPRRRLQSDPTAAYGCRLQPELPSCAAFTGRVRPKMLRDASNRYNTYSHAGLPPGPIANPGNTAISAVLQPAQTPYFFFVANPDQRGTHIFSRNLEEHRSAIRRGR